MILRHICVYYIFYVRVRAVSNVCICVSMCACVFLWDIFLPALAANAKCRIIICIGKMGSV